MTNEDILKTRCLLAEIIKLPPDNIEVINLKDNDEMPIFIVPYENQFEFCISFSSKPTKEEILIVLDEFRSVGQEWLEEDDAENYDYGDDEKKDSDNDEDLFL